MSEEDQFEKKLEIEKSSTAIRVSKELVLTTLSQFPGLNLIPAYIDKAENNARFDLIEKRIDFLIEDAYLGQGKSIGNVAIELVKELNQIQPVPELRKPDLCLRLMERISNKSRHALEWDPQINLSELEELFSEYKTDLDKVMRMAVHELNLQGWIYKGEAIGDRLGFHSIGSKPEFFEETDVLFQKWNPAEDAKAILKFPGKENDRQINMIKVCEDYKWSQRRLNPAISYLNTHGFITGLNRAGGMNYLSYYINLTDEALFEE
jgi:hypothetical protein